MKLYPVMLALAVIGPAAASAAVLKATPGGFALESAGAIAASPDQVFAALGQVGKWWDPAHSYSRTAANLTIDVRAGGCWCETVPPGGSVEHMRVVTVRPGKQLVARGGLGPLQGEGVDAALTWVLKADAAGTQLTQTYVVGGYARPGLEVLAPAVDGVMSNAFQRLKRYIETGSPDAAKPQ